ncbi:GDP-mannose 4,6-dehydratase [bacterium]|nr:GDP-mannose 4,6-dehydratase [bacterium]
MNILITGAAGFIGSHLSEALLKAKHRVLGIDNFNTFYDPALKRQNLADIQKTAEQNGAYFQCYSGDINDTDMLDTIFSTEKIDAVVHLAAMAGVRPSIQDPVLYEKVNCLGTLQLIEAVKKHGVKNFVFGSSSSVYGLNTKVPFSEDDPINLTFSPYAYTKRANELCLYTYHKLYNINTACLRFFTVYGPRQRPDLAIRKFTDLLYTGKPIPIFGDGSFKRDFTYVDDIIDGVVKSMDWCLNQKTPAYDIFNLGESATTSVLELIDLIEQTSGKKFVKEFHPAQPGDVPITFADISKSKKILGYNPQTPIKRGIEKFIKWYETK